MERPKVAVTILIMAMWGGWVEYAYSLSFINYDPSRPTIASKATLNGVGYVFSIAPGASTGSACTGSAISPTVVLTAAHCFDGPDAGGSSDYTTSSFRFRDPNGNILSMTGSPQTHPAYAGWEAGHNNDIAVLILNSSLPNYVHTYSVYSGDAFKIIQNNELTVAGYGRYAYGSGNSIELPRSSLEGHYGKNIYSMYNPSHSTIEAQYNNPGIVPTKFNDFTGEAATNPGDSGGPVFSGPIGEEVIMGVNSYYYEMNGNGLTDPGESIGATFVGNYAGWILSVAPNAHTFTFPKNAFCPPGIFCKPGTEDQTLLPTGSSGNPEDIPTPYFFERTPAGVPEPDTLYLLLLGLGSLALLPISKLRF